MPGHGQGDRCIHDPARPILPTHDPQEASPHEGATPRRHECEGAPDANPQHEEREHEAQPDMLAQELEAVPEGPPNAARAPDHGRGPERGRAEAPQVETPKARPQDPGGEVGRKPGSGKEA